MVAGRKNSRGYFPLSLLSKHSAAYPILSDIFMQRALGRVVLPRMDGANHMMRGGRRGDASSKGSVSVASGRGYFNICNLHKKVDMQLVNLLRVGRRCRRVEKIFGGRDSRTKIVMRRAYLRCIQCHVNNTTMDKRR